MALSRGFSPDQFRGAVLGTIGPFTVNATIPSIATGANGTVSVTANGFGLAVGDILFVLPQGAALVAGVDIEAIVTAANVFSLVAHNGSGGAFNPGAQNYVIVGLRFKTA